MTNKQWQHYTPIALRRESNFLVSTRWVIALCVRVYCIVCMCDMRNGYTQAYTQIMHHMHMHKAVMGRVEAKKLLSCVEGNQTIAYFFLRGEGAIFFFFWGGSKRIFFPKNY